MILLIDFDDDPERLLFAKGRVPLSDPEALRRALNNLPYESIGHQMAKDCQEGTDTIWQHELLEHNASELSRLRTSVRPILFPEA
jgi:hypothetical protein